MTIANMITMMMLMIAATYTEILTMMLTVLMMMKKKMMMMKMMTMMMMVMMMMQSMRPWPCLLIPCDHTRGLRGRPAHFTESRNLDFIDSVNP